MDSINYYFRSDASTKKDGGVRYLLQTFYMFHSKLWKGRRKDKDSPTPPNPEEIKEYLEEPNIKDRISDADFFKLVALPPSLDLHEWLATHTISFFNHVNLIYGVVSEYCTAEACPSMTAPDNVQYFWYDDKGKKTKHTANQYIDYVMSHIQKLINDESVFPTKFDHDFPADLEVIVKRIHKYLFHVLAHMYHAHYRLLHQLGLHAHLNTLFTHFMVFTSKFDLVSDKESDILLQLFSLLLKSLADPNQNPTLRQGLGIRDEPQNKDASGDAESANPQSSSTYPLHGEGDSSTPSSTTNPSSSARISNGGSNLMHTVCDTDSAANSSEGKQLLSSRDATSNGTLPPPSSQVITSSQLLQGEGQMIVDSEPLPSEWLSNLQVSAT